MVQALGRTAFQGRGLRMLIMTLGGGSFTRLQRTMISGHGQLLRASQLGEKHTLASSRCSPTVDLRLRLARYPDPCGAWFDAMNL